MSQGVGVADVIGSDGLLAFDVGEDYRGLNAARTVRLNPCVFGEDVAVEILAKEFDHVVAFKFAVNEDVESDFFLKSDALADEILSLSAVRFFGDFALSELSAILTDFGGLRE